LVYYRGHFDPQTLRDVGWPGEITASRAGRFRIEPLMFHLAGIPSYLVLAELAVKRVLRGVVESSHTLCRHTVRDAVATAGHG
jgi:hypothetical protein